MTLLILGLLAFFLVHSLRLYADGWRQRTVARLGLRSWYALYSVASLAGLWLLVSGYGAARLQPLPLWAPPQAMHLVTGLFMLLAAVLVMAALLPRNAVKARLKHPLLLSVKVWALAHLLSNGNLADVLLFGSFLLWAVCSFRAARRRDPAPDVAVSQTLTLLTTLGGLGLWLAFALHLHQGLIGVRPFVVPG